MHEFSRYNLLVVYFGPKTGTHVVFAGFKVESKLTVCARHVYTEILNCCTGCVAAVNCRVQSVECRVQSVQSMQCTVYSVCIFMIAFSVINLLYLAWFRISLLILVFLKNLMRFPMNTVFSVKRQFISHPDRFRQDIL